MYMVNTILAGSEADTNGSGAIYVGSSGSSWYFFPSFHSDSEAVPLRHKVRLLLGEWNSVNTALEKCPSSKIIVLAY